MHPAAHYGLTAAGWETIAILIVTLALIISNRVRLDLIALFLFVTLGAFKIVDQEKLFAGFGSEAVIVIASMLAIGSALVRSGVTDALAIWITRISGHSEKRMIPLLLTVGGLLSSFISDLAIVSIFLPVLLGIEKRFHIHASRLLLPFAVTSILGGLITMVGGATNIVANQIVEQSGLPRLALFSIAPLGFALLASGVLFIWLFGRFLLPKTTLSTDTSSAVLGIQEYLTELRVTDASSWIKKPLDQIPFFKENGINVVRILREQPVRFPKAKTVIQKGDVLLVQAHRDDLLKLRSTADYSVQPGVQKSLEELDISLAGEAIVRSGSEFVGKTLQQLHFRERFHVAVIAIWRNGQTLTARLASIQLKAGDMLLLQGSHEKMGEIGESAGLLMISQSSHVPRARQKGLLAVGIVALIFFLAARGYLPMTLAGILGVGLLVISRIIGFHQIYQAIEWKIIFFVSAMFALGTALKETGLIDLITKAIVNQFGHLGPTILLAICFWLASLTTQVISNTATTLLLTPVMINVATHLHYNPIPFVISVIVGVTASPFTYVSHKVFLLIMAPGGYRYKDYVRFGLPLTFVFFIITLLLVPALWHFQ